MYLKCISCEKHYLPEELIYTCPDCGLLKGTLEVHYDLDEIKKSKLLTRKKLKENYNFNIWRYLPILPINRPDLIIPLQVGWTPIYRSQKLEESLSLQSVWVKNDGQNPTGSYKDRASAVAIVKAQEIGATTVTAASTGNAASSWSAFAALAGLKNVIFVPENIPKAKVAQLLVYGAKVAIVQDNYDVAFDLCYQASQKWGWYNRSTAINPYLAEGKKTGALEICEQLEWKIPTHIIVSVGDGNIIQAMWKGFKEFYALGLIDSLPQMVGVQAEGAAPLVEAAKNNQMYFEAIKPETIADSIAVGIPRDGIKALKAVKESKGIWVSVSDQEILNAIPLLATSTGVLAEPAGATAMAGLLKLVKQGKMSMDDQVVVMVTGNGLKDIEMLIKSVANSPISVQNSLDDIENKFSFLF